MNATTEIMQASLINSPSIFFARVPKIPHYLFRPHLFIRFPKQSFALKTFQLLHSNYSHSAILVAFVILKKS